MKTLVLHGAKPTDIKLECADATVRQVALERLETLGMPNKKCEHLRYFPIEAVLMREYRLHAYRQGEIERGEAVVIENGIVTHAPEGVQVSTQVCDFVDPKHYDPLYYLNHLVAAQTIRLRCESGCRFEVIHRITRPETLVAYRLQMRPEDGVRCVETFDTKEAPNALVMAGWDIDLHPGHRFEWVRTHNAEEGDAALIASHRMRLEKESGAALTTFDFGGGETLNLYKLDLMEASHLQARHLLCGTGRSQRGNVTRIVHEGHGARSDQLAKHILKERARGIFDGLVLVEQSGAGTAAHQNAHAILLNDGAYMISKPQLEIYIDDLEASHGSTTGQLDPEQIFYLRSRGISEKEARKMLVRAFAEEVIESLQDENLQARVTEMFDHVYQGESL